MLRKALLFNKFLSTNIDCENMATDKDKLVVCTAGEANSDDDATAAATRRSSATIDREQRQHSVNAHVESQQVQQSKQRINSDGNNNSNNDCWQKKEARNRQVASAYGEKRDSSVKQVEYKKTSRNNNNNNNNNNNEGELTCSKKNHEEVGREEKCFAQEIDEWQLLEVEENSSLVDDVATSSNCLKQNNMAPTSTKLLSNDSLVGQEQNESDTKGAAAAVAITGIKRKYINIDPLGPHKERNSPTLIYLCTAIYSLLPLAATIATFTLIALAFTRLFPITLIYLAYIIWDRQTCNKGGQRIDWFYRSSFWSYLAAYFPIRLRHSPDFKLDPKKNYILNFSPHGISAFGSVTAFATNGLNFADIFPGIKARFMVHETSFMVPIMREVFAFRGDCSVNSKSIDYMLTKQATGNLLAIVVGGLAEADLSHSEKLKIVVAERKGFVKKALVHGADIIPCIAFGENSVFNKVTLPTDSLLHRLESNFYKLFKFKHPIYYGTSIFSDKLSGLMPFRRPITVVLDDPIRVNQTLEPTQDQIDKLHAKYICQLNSMYHANKDLCSKYDKQLELV